MYCLGLTLVGEDVCPGGGGSDVGGLCQAAADYSPGAARDTGAHCRLH